MSNTCNHCRSAFYEPKTMADKVDFKSMQKVRVGCSKCGTAVCFSCAATVADKKGKEGNCFCPKCGAELGRGGEAGELGKHLNGWDSLNKDEDKMSSQILQTDNVTTQKLKDLFEQAFYTVTSQKDFFIVQEQGHRAKIWTVQVSNNEQIKFSALFTGKKAPIETKLIFCNRINQEMNTLRTFATDQFISMDWYIPLDGGILERTVILSFKYFQILVDDAIGRDQEGLLFK